MTAQNEVVRALTAAWRDSDSADRHACADDLDDAFPDVAPATPDCVLLLRRAAEAQRAAVGPGSKLAGEIDKLIDAVAPGADLGGPGGIEVEAWEPQRRSGFCVGSPKGVKVTHSSGIVVMCNSERSQHMNRDKALRGLRAMLEG